jgi:hypothetical protein
MELPEGYENNRVLCCGCDSVLDIEFLISINTICPFCHSYRYDGNKEKVLKKINQIKDRKPGELGSIYLSNR